MSGSKSHSKVSVNCFFTPFARILLLTSLIYPNIDALPRCRGNNSGKQRALNCFSSESKILGDDLTVHVADLSPGTRYEVRVAALQKDPSGEEREAYSPSSYITTTGKCE